MAEKVKPEAKKAAAAEADEITELLTDDTVDVTAEMVPDTKEPTKVDKAADPVPAVAGDDLAAGRATKAGKRSAKAVAEAEEEARRKAAAQAKAAESNVKSQTSQVNKPNPLKQHGKNYRQAAELVDKRKQYELSEAIELAKQTVKVKFDPSLELHLNLGVDPRQADQMVRSSVVLPAGTGKSLRVAVLAPSAKHADAKQAGAEVVGEDDLIAKIEQGKINFDRLIATPDMMPKLSKVAKVLGPKGLMPNPKSGTVTPDVAKATAEAKAGKVEFRIDKQAIVHQAIGKASFKAEDLLANAKTLIDAVMKAKPSAAKGTYVKAMALATSMGPGIKLNVQKALAEANPKTK